MFPASSISSAVSSKRNKESKASQDKRHIEIKKRLAWHLCSGELLSQPISSLGVLTYDHDDSDDIKENKKSYYEKRKAEIEREQSAKEPELLKQLDLIMQRVVESRSRKPVDNEDVWAGGPGAIGGERASVLAALVCDLCGNKEHFIEDVSSGDTVCLGRDGDWSCGKVVQDRKIYEGAEKRNFADDDTDRHQHGPEADPLMPDSENLRTYIPIGNDPLSKELNRVHQKVEDNLSSIGNDERRTRTATRCKQKKEAFEKMSTVCSSLGIHRSVLSKANEEFARYRDVQEHVHKPNSVIAACLLLSHERILEEGGLVESVDEVLPLKYFGEDKLPVGVNNDSTLLAAEDVAISTLKEIPMGKWDSAQLVSWLSAVLEERVATIGGAERRSDSDVYMPLVLKIVSHIDSEQKSLAAVAAQSKFQRKRKYPGGDTPSFFGTTTMAHRSKKFYDGVKQQQHQTSAHHVARPSTGSFGVDEGAKTSGQIFMLLNLETVLADRAACSDPASLENVSDMVGAIRIALKTRTLYDAAVKKKVEVEQSEARRHMSETSSRFPTLKKSIGGDLAPSTTINSAEDIPSTLFTDTVENEDTVVDSMLLEMLSGNQTVMDVNPNFVDNHKNSDDNDKDKDDMDTDAYDIVYQATQQERNRTNVRFKIQK